MNLRVGIIGGGIGGLAAAVGAARGGAEVTVLEREPGPAGAGTALGLWPAALAALDELDLGRAVRAQAARQRSGAFLRADGARIAAIDTVALERRTGDPVYLLSRPALLDLLLAALPEGTVRFGHRAELAALTDAYDVVIAADGIFSATRRALFGPAYRARHLGTTAWRGVLDTPTDTFTETWGEGMRFGITPQEGGRTNWFAAAPAPAGQVFPEGDLAALRARFGDWHAAVGQVLAQLDDASLLRHDLYELAPRLPSYVRGRVALIGDAAHAMSPDLGRGACEALIDAVTLTRQLGAGGDPAAALAEYDRLRRRPTQRLAAMSRRVGRLAHARQLTRLRDTAVRVALRVGGPPN
ncbi:FAD-dependent monooxygenase [Natronosporangium hydrolyticum]|uniref:FAD-dependent monooxygenase n=1 Tax=Natronosporangium hydrolyticum TaxID=2811111 RepID=A0A895Y7H6_9ACTN|nr:FAD-dependent monooxygenase [Natronosporangium hydrolyticum]QSB13311.1 FAD-dependent monooxygenase [Natronosporangium hydrolyticum]